MNTDTGQLVPFETITEEMKNSFIPVSRDLTRIEELEMQIKLYAPCVCGSGKKFKFCCKTESSK